MSQQLQKYEKPGMLERIGNAFKSLAGNLPADDSGSSYVPIYNTWADWDRAIDGTSAGINYANSVGNLWQSSLVMAGIRWLGNTLPEPPLQVKESTGNKGESEVIPNHPLTDLWHRPNPFYSGSTLNKGIGFSWILKGDVYIRKVWNDAGTGVAELWWEPHWKIKPRWYGDNQGAYIPKSMSRGNPDNEQDDPNAHIAYYEIDRNGQKYRLEVNDVIHLRDGFDPANTRCGLSGLGSILREIYGDNEAANYYARLMGHSGIPPFIASVDKDVNMQPGELVDFANELERRVSGQNSQRKFMVAKGVTVEKLGLSPEELDLSDTRLMSEDRFAAVTGIPAVVLELAAGRKNSIYNNVKQAMERATDSYLKPLWRHIDEELTVQLLPDYETDEKALLSVKSVINRHRTDSYYQYSVKATGGAMRYVSHDLSKVAALQEDEDAKHRRVWGDYRNGGIDRYEFRSQLGFEPRDTDRDIYFPNTGAKEGEPEQPTLPTNDDTQPTKSIPPDDVQERAAEWWRDNAPEGAADLIDAVVKDKKANGDSEVLNG